jgi:thiol-disulfide isomerase/thioredoxin
MKSYITLRTLIVSGIITIAGLAWIFISDASGLNPNQEDQFAPQVGFQSPPFALETLDGDNFVLSELSGRPVIINFWASWCPPCKSEMPDFQQAANEYSETDLVITAINATKQDSIQNVRNFIEKEEITFSIPLDRSGSVSKFYNVHSLPTTYFIGRDGKVMNILIGGPIPLPLLRVEIEKLIQE